MAVPKIDPNVKIPSAVLAASQRSEAIFNQVNGIEEKPETPAAEVTVEPPALAPSEPVAAPATPEPSPAVNWEHRYNSMKGRFEQAQNQIREQNESLRAMGERITQLQTAATVTPRSPRELDAASLITPQETAEYGEEFLTVVGKKAREVATPEINELRARLDTLANSVQGVGQVTFEQARRNLEATMDSQCTNWREVNYDEAFHDWLSLPDAYSGVIRHELLKAAYERNDTPRVLAFFKGFLAEEAAVAPAVEPAPSQDDKSTDKVPLETLAAPGRAKTAAAPPAPAEKPTFTRAFITKFYSDSAAGKYRGREQEKNRVEAQIFEAEREGRIR